MNLQWTSGLRSKNQSHDEISIPKKRFKKKVRVKDGKVHEILEDMIRSMIETKESENTQKQSVRTDVSMQDIINIQSAIQRLENNVISKFVEVEHEFARMRSHIDDVHKTSITRNEKLESDFQRALVEIKTNSEKDKARTLKTFQKLHAQHTNDVEQLNKDISTTSGKSYDLVQTVNNDIQVASRDITTLKINVDALMRRRYGASSSPGPEIEADALGTSFNHGVDAGIALDQLATRMRQLESRLTGMEHQEVSERLRPSLSRAGYVNTSKSSDIFIPQHSGRYAASGSQKDSQLQDLTSSVRDLQTRVTDSEDLLEKLALSMHSNEGSSVKRDKAPKTSGLSRGGEREGHTSDGGTALQSVQNKLKTLGSSTSRACKSLSVGLNDCQHATLLLYSWADRVYTAFDVVSSRLDFPSNICPRPHVYRPEGLEGGGLEGVLGGIEGHVSMYDSRGKERALGKS